MIVRMASSSTAHGMSDLKTAQSDAVVLRPAQQQHAVPTIWTVATVSAVAACVGVFGATTIGPLVGEWAVPNAQPWVANVVGGAVGVALGIWLGQRRSHRIYDVCHTLQCEEPTFFDVVVLIVLGAVSWAAIGLFLGYLVGAFGQMVATWKSAIAVLALAGGAMGLAMGVTDKLVHSGSARLAAHVAAGATIGAIAGQLIGGPLAALNMAIFMGGFHSKVLWEEAAPDETHRMDSQ